MWMLLNNTQTEMSMMMKEEVEDIEEIITERIELIEIGPALHLLIEVNQTIDPNQDFRKSTGVIIDIRTIVQIDLKVLFPLVDMVLIENMINIQKDLRFQIDHRVLIPQKDIVQTEDMINIKKENFRMKRNIQI